MELRTADIGDAAELAAALDAFNREFDSPTPGAAVLAERLRSMLATGAMVALLAGRPAIGLATLIPRPSAWEDGPVGLLEDLWVRPDLRSRGIGAALLHAAEAALTGLGGTRMEIPVDGVDTDARRFYEREGYAHVEDGSPLLTYFRDLG